MLELHFDRKTVVEILARYPSLEADDVAAAKEFLMSVGSVRTAEKLGITRRRLIGWFDKFEVRPSKKS